MVSEIFKLARIAHGVLLGSYLLTRQEPSVELENERNFESGDGKRELP